MWAQVVSLAYHTVDVRTGCQLSIHTAQYCCCCCRAKNITNKPRINEDPKDAMLREFQEEIQRLKAALQVGLGRHWLPR
jgi:hypothetical protein